MTTTEPAAPAAAEARRTLGAIAAWDLDGCRPRLPEHALADQDWARLLGLARAQRAEGVLATAIAAGALAVTPAQQDQAYTAHQAAMSLVLLLERDLLALLPRFAAAGIDVRVTKGVATSHLDEPDPSFRAFGDVDLLVPAPLLPAAIEIVTEAGGSRRHAEPRPGFDVRFGKGVSFRFTRNCEIDLHRTLAPGPFGLRIDLDELFAGRTTFTIAGTELDALDRPGRFLHACYHAALGDALPRLTTLRDLVRTAPATDVECRTVLARAERWEATAVVAAAVGHAVHALAWEPPEPLGSWDRHASHPRRQRRWLAAYAGDRRLPALQAIQGIGALDRRADQLAYARAIAFPARSERRTPTRERARRGARALVRLPRP